MIKDKKICVINIATNKYIGFIQPLWESIFNNFLENCVVESLLFTDHDVNPITKNGKVSKIKHEPFPIPTLMRYHYINSESEYLKQFDYCFYLDADMLINDKVGEEILGNLVATIHPGFFNKNLNYFTYERNQSSLAYIPFGSGNRYYAGGFNGGIVEEFLKMSRTISNNIDIDKQNNIIALWHDESYLNRYLLDNPPTLELSPAYCYPENWSISFEKKILALDKNHVEIRS
jgi:histo-blood group ABO system transferase